MYLTQPIHKTAREMPQAMALLCAGRERNWADLAGHVARGAAVLRAHGMQPGDRVGVLAHNSDQFIAAVYAIWWGGGVINPVNTRWSKAEISYSLRDSDTTLLLADDDYADMAAALLAEEDVLREVIALDGANSFESLIADAAPIPDAMRQGEDLAAIMYTGGTTGLPKGVMLSHRAMVSNAMSVLASAPHAGTAPTLHVAPFYHIGGLGSFVQAMYRQAPQIIIPAFDEAEILRLTEAHGIADLFVVPTMMRRLVDHPDCKTRDCSTLRSVRYGAAPMDAALLADAMQAFPGAGFYHLYGQTEFAPVISMLPPADHTTEPDVPRMRSTGRPVVGCEVSILDDNGAEVPCGTLGQIAARGASMMDGYWNKPDETAAAMVDGWLMTGDVGRLDADGYLYILDRLKDMIISGGENVYSTEVENALATFDGVVLCAVVGKPDPEWGETVHAVIQTRDGAPLDTAALTAHCRAQIAGYKVPRSYAFVSAMPLSPAGKILKRDLREMPSTGEQERKPS